MNSSASQPDPARVSAWLDGQLDAEAAAAVASQVEGDAELRAQAEDFKRLDSVLKEWYADLPVEELAAVRSPVALESVQPRRRYRLLPLTGVIAAAVAIVLLAIPLMQGQSAMSHAQEVMDNTGRAIRASRGLVAKFRISTVKHGADPQATEKRKGEGQIDFGDLNAALLMFQSEEKWTATAEEGGMTRRRLQTRHRQIISEEHEESSTTSEINGPADVEAELRGFQEAYKGGSPVDVRSNRAVEGLAMLVRSFRQDRFLQWMGYKWTYQKGTGTRNDPWVYATTPGTLDPASKPAAEPIAWTMRCTGEDGLIKTIALQEKVTDLKTNAVLAEIETEYELALRSEPWPDEKFADKEEEQEKE